MRVRKCSYYQDHISLLRVTQMDKLYQYIGLTGKSGPDNQPIEVGPYDGLLSCLGKC